ncbi:type II toxin-antitoxin system Phd/YefM family antitoxin [Methylobacterium sp. WCS2018Hpa-22]|uniref:type II toxin-antitoxin system Phd/YefM family antitoxin n=1 Tax=unclassified Methylobacterium TaxID=2615210 RepID=UPI000A5FBB99|nr:MULTISPECIES: type II toxin-antitoxin system Phd/YefM family antitoxin [unclassified Methylobacterium]
MEAQLQSVMADVAVSVSELKKSPTSVMNRADGAPVAILNHNRVMGYMVPPETFEAMMDAIDDDVLASIVKARSGEVPVRVTLDAL